MTVPIILKPANTKIWIPCQDTVPVNRPVTGATMGTITNYGSPTQVDGKIGKALYFDSSATTKQYSDTSVNRLGSGTSLSFFAWVYAIPNGSGMFVFSNTGTNGGSQNASPMLILSSGNVNTYVGAYNDGQPNGSSITSTANVFNRWSFIGINITYNVYAYVSLFVNGEFTTKSNSLAYGFQDSLIYSIGRGYTSGASFFNGYISHIWMGNTSLSEKEFNVIYNSTKGRFLL